MRTLSELPVPFIIGDVGSNWCISSNPEDNLIMAKRHIFDGSRAGLNAVKFQLFTDKELYGFEGPNKYSLPREWIPELAAYATHCGVEFMCTAFSPEGYRFIDPFVNIHKVASCEMKHVEILDTLATDTLALLQKPILVSTGGAHHEEFETVERHLDGCDWAFLECVAHYPAEPSNYNLSVLKNPRFVGISDHTRTDIVALASLGLGARVFEKHFKSLYGILTPDASVSLGPTEMADYVNSLREGVSALGDGIKRTRSCEKDVILRHGRRLKVINPIKQGEKLQMNVNYGIYRSLINDPEAGPPEAWEQFNGGIAKRDLEPGDPVWTSTVQCEPRPTS